MIRSYFKFKKINVAKEMDQWLKSQNALSENPGSVISTHMIRNNHLNFIPIEHDELFSHVAHICMQVKQAHAIKIKASESIEI